MALFRMWLIFLLIRDQKLRNILYINYFNTSTIALCDSMRGEAYERLTAQLSDVQRDRISDFVRTIYIWNVADHDNRILLSGVGFDYSHLDESGVQQEGENQFNGYLWIYDGNSDSFHYVDSIPNAQY